MPGLLLLLYAVPCEAEVVLAARYVSVTSCPKMYEEERVRPSDVVDSSPFTLELESEPVVFDLEAVEVVAGIIKVPLW